MGYLIRTIGIDLGSVSSGLAVVEMRAGSWETTIADAGAIHIHNGHNRKQTQFSQHHAAASKIVEYVKKHKPDLVGIEDYTNQTNSHVAFSLAQVGGMVRLLLWQSGFRQILIAPSRIATMVVHRLNPPNKVPAGPALKKYTKDWIKLNLGQEFQGAGPTAAKQVEDMVDATIYGVIAAAFFSQYWLNQYPPLTTKQRSIFYSDPPSPKSVLWARGWLHSGLMDLPYRYLIRNPAVEAQTYTPEWLKTKPDNFIFLGDGTPDFEFPSHVERVA